MITSILPLMALNGLYCAHVPLSNYSLTYSGQIRQSDTKARVLWAVTWSETDGLMTRSVSDQKIGLNLGLAGLVLCCETRQLVVIMILKDTATFKYYL